MVKQSKPQRHLQLIGVERGIDHRDRDMQAAAERDSDRDNRMLADEFPGDADEVEQPDAVGQLGRQHVNPGVAERRQRHQSGRP